MANIPPNYTPNVGGLSTNRYDFETHVVTGTAFRHNATQIDLLDPVVVGTETYTTVETAIDAITGVLAGGSAAEVGLITIPDGYDTYHAANNTSNFDHTIPSLDTFLNPLFSALMSGNGIPTPYAALTDGGILVIPSGTYIIKNTVIVPPGITLMGMGFGTKIVNTTAINTSGTPPYSVSGTPTPVFKIAADNTLVAPSRAQRTYTDAAIDANVFMFSRETRIWNMLISDNFVEPTFLGDSYYTSPQNTSSSTALIQQENGSNLSLYNVSIQGRVSFSSGTVVSSATSSAIYLDTTFSAPTGTILSVDKCFIDGFSVPIQWQSKPGSSATFNGDFLTVSNSKIRGYGYLGGNSSDNFDNSIITMNDNNATIVGNYFYGNSSVVQSIVYMKQSQLTSPPNFGARSKILVSSNNIEIDRTSTITNSTFNVLNINSTNLPTPSTYSSILEYGNNFQDTFTINVDGYRALQASPSGTTIRTMLTSTVVVTGTYSISNTDCIVIANTATAGVNITLPTIASSGRTLIIKDIGFASTSHPVTITAQSGNFFDSSSLGTYTIVAPATSLTLVSYGSQWFII